MDTDKLAMANSLDVELVNWGGWVIAVTSLVTWLISEIRKSRQQKNADEQRRIDLEKNLKEINILLTNGLRHRASSIEKK